MAFTVTRQTPLAPDRAFAAVSDLAEHTRHVPLTDVAVPEHGVTLGSEVVAWTRLGPLRVADRMLVTALDPGRRLRIVKTGRWLRGWADIEVVADPSAPGATTVSWREELWLPGLRPLTRPLGDRLGALLFGRLVDGLLRRAEAEAVRPAGPQGAP